MSIRRHKEATGAIKAGYTYDGGPSPATVEVNMIEY